MSRGRAAVVALALASASCAAPRAPDPAATPIVAPPSPSSPPIAQVADEPLASEAELVRSMLERVAAVRGLPIREAVSSRTLDRAAIGALIRAHVERDVPLDAVVAQGEALIALELVPTDYDLEGSLALLNGSIAGFYEPADRTMYLVDDLGDEGAEETLMHELVHALQDQSFSIGPMLKFAPGEGDRLAAAHALIEGDATSAMFDVQMGSAFKLTDAHLRALLELSSAASPVGAVTPQILQNALGAPYADGFAFVKALRKRGGYAAVDAVFRQLPDTTEQILHLDKLDAREPAVAVRAPVAPPNMPGFLPIFEDSMGEQGLRIVLEEWTSRPVAERAAAGWGGDRYVVLERRTEDAAPRELAIAWQITMDTLEDATELGAVLRARFGPGCRERAVLGPIAWRARGEDLTIVAGPYRRAPTRAASSGSCTAARRWATALLESPRTRVQASR